MHGGATDSVRSSDLCARCASIDLDVIFSRKVVDTDSPLGEFVMPLDATAQELRNSNCPLCRLFGSVVLPRTEKLCHLRAFPGSSAFQDHPVHNHTTALAVVALSAAEVDSGRFGVGRQLQQLLYQTGYLCYETFTQGPAPPRPDSCIICPDYFNDRFAQKCIAHCENHHSEVCNPPSTPNLPFLKLIDCITRKIIAASTESRYIALSYVWGSSTSDSLAGEVLDVEDIYLPKLSRVVEDSIIVATMLGIQYLWVDRYCIDQTDTDKHDQISNMDAIYTNAHITIIAAAGSDPNYGLPGVNGQPRNSQPLFQIGNHQVISTLPHARASINGSKWASRGWTYQEGLLSRRRLIFTDDQVYFECDALHCAESLPLSSFDLISQASASSPQSSRGVFLQKSSFGQNSWQMMSCIAEFSVRELTFPEDILNAMQGVFRSFAKSPTPVHNLLGIPLTYFYLSKAYGFGNSLLMGLTWSHRTLARRNCFFPSWSWAGWIGKVNSYLLYEPRSKVDPNARVSIQIGEGPPQTLSTLDVLQATLSGSRKERIYLQISALVVACQLSRPIGSDDVLLHGPNGLPPLHEIMLDREWEHGVAAKTSCQPCLCVIIGSVERPQIEDAVLLVVEGMGDHFERIGIAEFQEQTQEERLSWSFALTAKEDECEDAGVKTAEWRTIKLG